MISDSAAQIAAWMHRAEAAGSPRVSLSMKHALLRALELGSPVKCLCSTRQCAAAALPAAMSPLRLKNMHPAQLECCARRLFLLGAPTHLQILHSTGTGHDSVGSLREEAMDARWRVAFAALFASPSIPHVARLELWGIDVCATPAVSELTAALVRGTAAEKVPSPEAPLRALRHLCIGGTRLPPSAVRRLVRAVQHHGGIEVLRLEYLLITADDLPAATTAPAVSSLSLSGCTGPWTSADDAAAAMGTAIRAAFPALCSLCMSMAQVATSALCAVVGAVGPLSSLDISAVSTTLDVDMAVLLRPSAGTLRSLSVHQQELAPASVASLAAVVAAPECRLTALDVSSCGRACLKRMLVALKRCGALRRMRFGSNDAKTAEARAAVSLINTLEDTRRCAPPDREATSRDGGSIADSDIFDGYELDLCNSPLQQAGAAVLVPVLHSLRMLNLSFCDLRDPGVKTLATALRGAPHLTSLSLVSNDFSEASLPFLTGTVTRGLPALRLLDLSGNTELGKAKDSLVVARSLASIVAVTPALELVDLSYCDLGALVIRAVVEKGVIARHVAVMEGAGAGPRSLKCADLKSNKLDEEGTKESNAAACAVDALSDGPPLRAGPAALIRRSELRTVSLSFGHVMIRIHSDRGVLTLEHQLVDRHSLPSMMRCRSLRTNITHL